MANKMEHREKYEKKCLLIIETLLRYRAGLLVVTSTKAYTHLTELTFPEISSAISITITENDNWQSIKEFVDAKLI